LRLNFFVGFKGTHHLIRDVLGDDQRVAKPTVSQYFGKQIRAFNKPIIATKTINSVLPFMFESTEGKECNVGVMGFTEEIVDFLLSYSPDGSRVWFFKHIDDDTTKSLFIDYINNKARNQWAEKYLKMNLEEFKNGNQREIIDKIFPTLDDAAIRLGAQPWKQFNLSEYFEDGVDKPTNISVRVYIKS
jgi:hypothetical protein